MWSLSNGKQTFWQEMENGLLVRIKQKGQPLPSFLYTLVPPSPALSPQTPPS